MNHHRTLLASVALVLVAAGIANCGNGGSPLSSGGAADDDDGNAGFTDNCRFNPDGCFGEIGGNCDGNSDCNDGFCCDEDSNCGGGMCTISCDDDADCPSFMACEHDVCFFRCDDDDDCASGQSCEHGNTVCEWP